MTIQGYDMLTPCVNTPLQLKKRSLSTKAIRDAFQQSTSFQELSESLYSENVTIHPQSTLAKKIHKARQLWSQVCPEQPEETNPDLLPFTATHRENITYKVHGIPHTIGDYPSTLSHVLSANFRRSHHDFISFTKEQIQGWEKAGEMYLCEQGLAQYLNINPEVEIPDYSILINTPAGYPLNKDFNYSAALALLRTQFRCLAEAPGHLGYIFKEDPEFSEPASTGKARLAKVFSSVADSSSLWNARKLYLSLVFPPPIQIEYQEFILETVRSQFPSSRYNPAAYALLYYWISPLRDRVIADYTRNQAKRANSPTVHVLTGVAHEPLVSWYFSSI